MVTGFECSVTTPTSGGVLAGRGLEEEQAANVKMLTRQKMGALRMGKQVRVLIMKFILTSFSTMVPTPPTHPFRPLGSALRARGKPRFAEVEGIPCGGSPSPPQ